MVARPVEAAADVVPVVVGVEVEAAAVLREFQTRRRYGVPLLNRLRRRRACIA